MKNIVVNSASCDRMFCWGNFPPALEKHKTAVNLLEVVHEML